ncbi:MAG: formylglycine-generating enzyme family protein [Verrucomicrobia bacterium]|nr:formylglycine-generating enzyme family protein [Verrucomicrobiota bacterium]
MQKPSCTLLVALLALAPNAQAQQARFFRIAGPVPTSIVELNANGYLTWSNVATNATFTVQSAAILPSPGSPPDPGGWSDYARVPATQSVTALRILDPHSPPRMAFVPAGLFQMGDPWNEGNPDELPVHPVYVSGFHLDSTEVTKALWDAVRIWGTENGYDFENIGAGATDGHPVYRVSWYDVVKWCNARSEMENRAPAYYTGTEQLTVYRSGRVDVRAEWVRWDSGYRLPTEAEWEKAARGGPSEQRFPTGNTIGHAQANYYSSYESLEEPYDLGPTPGYHPTFSDGINPYPSPAGYFAANGYGLQDMAGNVWEWCWDWYHDRSYPSVLVTDPRGSGETDERVYRGGACSSRAWGCRVAFRGHDRPHYAGDWEVGFRSLLPLDEP